MEGLKKPHLISKKWWWTKTCLAMKYQEILVFTAKMPTHKSTIIKSTATSSIESPQSNKITSIHKIWRSIQGCIKKYALNKDCETRVVVMDTKLVPTEPSCDHQHQKLTKSFMNILPQVTVHHLELMNVKNLKYLVIQQWTNCKHSFN